MMKTTPNVALLTTVKIRGRVGEMNQLMKLYLRPNLRNTFDGNPLRGCSARWIDKKEKEERK